MSFLGRLSALGWFLLAAAWYLFSDLAAMRAASGLTFGDYFEPLYRIFLVFLLLLGYALLSMLSQRRVRPLKNIGVDPRPGRLREWALGAAVGWAGVVACVLPTALIGGLVFTVFTNSHQLVVAFLDLIALAAGTLAVEVAFRGYGFFRLAEALGPGLATLFMAAIYAIWRTHAAPTSTAAVVVSFLLGWALALAALRTRALWVSWGFHFAWAAVTSLLFGLPMAGGMNYSPIFVTNAAGPTWLTGGTQGPEGSAFGVAVGFLLLIAIVRVTADLKHKYGYAEIVPGGIPVDIDAAARAQHEAAMGAAQPGEPQLVQILAAQPGVPLAGQGAEPGAQTVDGEGRAASGLAHEEPSPALPDEEPPAPEAS